MSPSKNTGAKPQLLFQFKKGGVTVEVHGPRIGWRWREIRYFRWMKSTEEPGQWKKVLPNRDCDQLHLEHCVKAVRAWLKEEESSLAAIHRRRC